MREKRGAGAFRQNQTKNSRSKEKLCSCCTKGENQGKNLRFSPNFIKFFVLSSFPHSPYTRTALALVLFASNNRICGCHFVMVAIFRNARRAIYVSVLASELSDTLLLDYQPTISALNPCAPGSVLIKNLPYYDFQLQFLCFYLDFAQFLMRQPLFLRFRYFNIFPEVYIPYV